MLDVDVRNDMSKGCTTWVPPLHTQGGLPGQNAPKGFAWCSVDTQTLWDLVQIGVARELASVDSNGVFGLGGPFGASWVFGSERLQGCTPLIIELVDALDDVRMPALIAMGHVEAGDIHAILGELQHHVVFQ